VVFILKHMRLQAIFQVTVSLLAPRGDAFSSKARFLEGWKSCVSDYHVKNSFTVVNSARRADQIPEIQIRIRKALALTLIGFGTSLVPFKPAYCLEYKLFDEVFSIVKDNFFDNTYNGNNIERLRVDYDTRLKQGAEETELTKNFLSLLGDKYTRLLDKEYFQSLWKYDAIGIGLLFQSDPQTNQMYVASPPIPGSSSEIAGIVSGDLIYSINGRSTSGMSAMDLLNLMSNDESDHVQIEYSHASKLSADRKVDKSDVSNELSPDINSKGNDDKITVNLKRSKQEARNPVVFSALITNDKKHKIGYIRLKEFNAEAVSYLRDAIVALESGNLNSDEDLDKQPIDHYILDLRGNTGGGFQFALNIGGLFMGEGKPMVIAIGI